ncbi:MAG: hypothetical protein HFH35_04955 [Eubacterium sp.]|nr:hypothetical protein [Eubacterium sp.]
MEAVKTRNYKICAAHNITRWDEALALGNGQMGCLVWGGPSGLRFSLDRTDIWDDSVPVGINDAAFTYENLVRLARGKQTDTIRAVFDSPYQHPTPTKLPAGKIILHMPQYENVESQLDLDTAQARLQLSGNAGESAEIKSIVHAGLAVGMILVNLPIGDFSVALLAPDFGKKEITPDAYATSETEKICKGSLRDLSYEKPKWETIHLEHGSYVQYFCQKINAHVPKEQSAVSYGIVMGVCAKADQTMIYYRIVTTKDGEDVFEAAVCDIKKYMDASYETLFSSHVQWWKEYWAQSSVCLADKEMEKNWYIANYLLASCSRKGYYPMPLQGVWTADEDLLAPWKGDYHNDLNTQMSYYSYLKANHILQGACFVDFLWDTKNAAAEFARSFYAADGICLPAVMTIKGEPLGGWPMYSLSPTNQIWLCRAFDDYYRYTGDLQFLKERLYPYMKETALCIGALLEKGPDGLLYLPISSSPEIHDDEAEAFLKPNSNYDLALLLYLYQTLEQYARFLAADAKAACVDAAVWETDLQKWQETGSRLPPLAVDKRGVLMLADNEILTQSHRHFSHAHAIHPLRLLSYDTKENRRIIDAVIRDLEQLGTRMWVGYSFCWMAELYAVAHKGEQAAEMLRVFWDSFCSPNGFHLNGDYKKRGYSSFDYRPFTLEGNMCAADALQEMLLYTERGEVEPFPAVPAQWLQDGVSFQNFRAEGAILVSAKAEKGKLTSLLLEAPCACSRRIRGWTPSGEPQPDAGWECSLQKGKNAVIKL